MPLDNMQIGLNSKVFCSVLSMNILNDFIYVTDAPSTPAILSDKGLQLEVIEDEDISLKCDSNGNPVPRITWLRGAQIIGHGNKYTISNAKRLDAGTYTCRARNGVDTAENQKQLVVKCNYIIFHLTS